jgi:hypothetical protein
MFTEVAVVADYVPAEVMDALTDGFTYEMFRGERRLQFTRHTRHVLVGEANYLDHDGCLKWLAALPWMKYTEPQYGDEGGGVVTVMFLYESGPASTYVLRGPGAIADDVRRSFGKVVEDREIR